MIIDKISNTLFNFLNKKNSLDSSEKEILLYGTNALLYTIISTIGLILFGLCTGMLFESLIIIAIFYTNQTVGGGFHSKTHIGCFVAMLCGLSVGLFLLKTHFGNLYTYLFISIIGLATMFFIPVVLNKHKAHLSPCLRTFSHRSRIVVAIEAFSSIIIYITNTHLFIVVSIALFFSSVSRVIGHLFSQHHNH